MAASKDIARQTVTRSSYAGRSRHLKMHRTPYQLKLEPPSSIRAVTIALDYRQPIRPSATGQRSRRPTPPQLGTAPSEPRRLRPPPARRRARPAPRAGQSTLPPPPPNRPPPPSPRREPSPPHLHP